MKRTGAYDSSMETSQGQRMNTLTKLMSRDSYSSLAIEQLPQQEKALEQTRELEVTD